MMQLILTGSYSLQNCLVVFAKLSSLPSWVADLAAQSDCRPLNFEYAFFAPKESGTVVVLSA